MGPRSKLAKRTTNTTRAPANSEGDQMVRASSIFPSVTPRLGNVVGWIANRYAGPLRPRSSLSAWQVMPPWRRLTCHIAPVFVSIVLGIVAVQLFGNRYQPRQIISSEIIPYDVVPGSTAQTRIEARDERQCTGMSRRWIVDSAGIIYDLWPIPTFQHEPNGTDPTAVFKFVHEFPVPLGITPGPATLYALNNRWCNVLQQWFWPIPSLNADKFNVKG